MQSWLKETDKVAVSNSSPSLFFQPSGRAYCDKWLVVIQIHLFYSRVAPEKHLPSLFASRFASIADFH